MIASVILSIVVGLAVLRRAIEPACPACSSKHWGDGSDPLSCEQCGWSATRAGNGEAASQYEMSLK